MIEQVFVGFMMSVIVAVLSNHLIIRNEFTELRSLTGTNLSMIISKQINKSITIFQLCTYIRSVKSQILLATCVHITYTYMNVYLCLYIHACAYVVDMMLIIVAIVFL